MEYFRTKYHKLSDHPAWLLGLLGGKRLIVRKQGKCLFPGIDSSRLQGKCRRNSHLAISRKDSSQP